MYRVGISTESVADLPESVATQCGIRILDFEVTTEEGTFSDPLEINTPNVLEYIGERHKKAFSVEPVVGEYKKLFEDMLKDYDEIIHICITESASISVELANLAKAKMALQDHRIHIVNSMNLSGGQGIMAVLAARLRDEGKNATEIVSELNNVIPKINTSFITKDIDYIAYSGKINTKVAKWVKYFNLHPVIKIKNGKMVVKRVYIGNYNKACEKYVRSHQKNLQKIDKKDGFIVYSGCPKTVRDRLSEVGRSMCFENFHLCSASAAVATNCGPNSFGIIYKEK